MGEKTSTQTTEISNPLCGDTLFLYRLKTHEAEKGLCLSFECECCGIAMGNASLMTLMMEGAPLVKAQDIAHCALRILRGEAMHQDEITMDYLADDCREEAEGGWQLLREIAQHMPSRKTCASLAWQALLADLQGQSQIIAFEVK